METKELDCLLVEAKSDEGYLLKFTIRGKDAGEVHRKWEEYRIQFFPGLTPGVQAQQVQAPQGGMQGALGNCSKCGAPNKLSKQGKAYCSATCWLK